MANRIRLGVNVDHVATVRQARRVHNPDPVAAAVLAEMGGADQITVHLREDRRHIQDRDVRVLRQTVSSRLNLEMGIANDIFALALDVLPHTITLVPEKREELTTEGGLNVEDQLAAVRSLTQRAQAKGIEVSLFIDPDEAQVRASKASGATAIELHTGRYCDATTEEARVRELVRLQRAASAVSEQSLSLRAGHGLDLLNLHGFLSAVPWVEEVNIGHSIVARAILVGMERSVREFRDALDTFSASHR